MVAPKACHNCRTRRLRCDRSVPGCYKCASAGRECLGYGKLYKWVDNSKPRNQIRKNCSVSPTRKTEDDVSPKLENAIPSRLPLIPYDGAGGGTELLTFTPNFSPLDPLVQDLDQSSRYYLNYFAARFSQDLVLYDAHGRIANPYRDLIPISQKYPFLREIIVAASAMHFSNVVRWDRNPRPAADSLVDALHARHRAIRALQTMIEQYRYDAEVEIDAAEKDALLAAVLFFVNFVLLDSGKGGWRAHMIFLGRLLSMRTSRPSQLDPAESTSELNLESKTSPTASLSEPLVSVRRFPSPLSQSIGVHDYIASDSVAYYIWSYALDSLVSSNKTTIASTLTFDGEDIEVFHTLARTEANSYHSCPAQLLYAIFQTSKIARDIRSNGPGILTAGQAKSCMELLDEIQEFDSSKWASEACTRLVSVVGHVVEVEEQYRIHIAETYRAAVHLYVLLVAPGLRDQAVNNPLFDGDISMVFPNTADLAASILHHMSFIPTSSPLFKFATWPIFLTGVETADAVRRTWALDKLRSTRELCPWGMLNATMETLVEIWRIRDSASPTTTDEGDLSKESTTASPQENNDKNWLMQLQGLKIDCLIV
ncbi:hypothetical protein M426DRAFT_231931 [Hypoxylon sp. CI-4A]|nr:hypothetical protein M426DRAFT_231931 [Hypoxylon sp. CI-4A]